MSTTPLPEKDRITCHVLDTSLGVPARGVRVQLSYTPPATAPLTTAESITSLTSGPETPFAAGGPTKTFESLTDEDGRVKVWLPYSSAHASGEVPVYTLDEVLQAAEAEGHEVQTWVLRFDTAAYFTATGGRETFFPEVVVSFAVKKGERYHVPLLLSPYSYSTYRGS